MLKPPFTYFGGKTTIAAQIAAVLPAHEHYVEPFAGSLAVLLAKRPAPMETVNDLDGVLMNFWRVLRDRPQDLARVCALTPHARAEALSVAGPPSTWPAGLDELELARLVSARRRGMAGLTGSGLRCCGRTGLSLRRCRAICGSRRDMRLLRVSGMLGRGGPTGAACRGRAG